MGQKTLIVIFGGGDKSYLDKYSANHLSQGQEHYGKVATKAIPRTEPDEIIASFLTGQTPDVHGVVGSNHYTNPIIQRLENRLPTTLVGLRRRFYDYVDDAIDGFNCKYRRYLASEIKGSTLFEEIPDSKGLFIPSYNPEIQWCIYRNTIRPNEYPELGVDGAQELIEKNFYWRKYRLNKALDDDQNLLVVHFQFLDSMQHIYYQHLNDEQTVRKAYERIDSYGEQLLTTALSKGWDNIVFMSEHGRVAPNSEQTHRRRAFYSVNRDIGIQDDCTIFELRQAIVSAINE